MCSMTALGTSPVMSDAFDRPIRMSVELMLGIEIGQPSGTG